MASRRSDMRIGVAWALLIASACMPAQPQARPSPQPGPSSAPPVHSIWAYEATLLPPRDASTYENVLLDAKPLSDGGWLVLRAVDPRRSLVDPAAFGPLIRQPYGELLKLDVSGRIVAKEHAAEPLGLTKIDVFEEVGVVVAQGRQVRNGTVHALRLDTLDGIASELTSCVAIDGRCWSFRTSRAQGSTALEERDPRTLAVIRTYPHLTMDGLYGRSAIFPSANLIAWQRPGPTRGVRAEALDPARPIAIGWLDRLRRACDVVRVGDDRAWVADGPAGCDYGERDAGWSSDLVEVSTGKVLRRLRSDEGVSSNELAFGRLVLAPVPLAIDPRSGSPGPVVPDHPVELDFGRGVAVVPLTGGGAAVLRRLAATGQPRAAGFSSIASGRCRDVDFPRVVVGPADFACAGFSAHVRAGQLLVATGRNYRSPVDFEVTDVTLDAATREIQVGYSATSAAPRPMESGPVRVIELSDVPAGEWLMKIVGGRGLATAFSSGAASTFVVRLGR